MDLSYNAPPSWGTVSLVSQTLSAIVFLFQTNAMHSKHPIGWFLEWCMDSVDSGLVAWDIEEWMSPFENRKSISKEKLVESRKPNILVGEMREVILHSLLQVSNIKKLFVCILTFFLALSK